MLAERQRSKSRTSRSKPAAIEPTMKAAERRRVPTVLRPSRRRQPPPGVGQIGCGAKAIQQTDREQRPEPGADKYLSVSTRSRWYMPQELRAAHVSGRRCPATGGDELDPSSSTEDDPICSADTPCASMKAGRNGEATPNPAQQPNGARRDPRSRLLHHLARRLVRFRHFAFSGERAQRLGVQSKPAFRPGAQGPQTKALPKGPKGAI